MTPRVTVLLAVKDGEPWIGEAVTSVLGQTFHDLELLVVDDASTDRTLEIVEAFDDRRVRVLRNDRNLGQVPSLNRGLREAHGELVARLDADDRCMPTRLERQVALLDAEPDVGLVGSWLELVDETGRRIGSLQERLEDRAGFLFQTLVMRVYVSHPAAMYRLAPALELGGYDESTEPAEDKDLWRRLLLAGWDARIVPEPLVVYRLHDAQLSRTRAAYQRQVDGESQERFLAALAPRTPVHALRLALADDEQLWGERREIGEVLRALEAVVSGARERLDLDEVEVRRVEQLTAAWLLRVARRRPWRPEAFALAAWALDRLPADRRRAAVTAQALSFPFAPARAGAASASRALARLPALRRARRSRLARRVYGRLIG